MSRLPNKNKDILLLYQYPKCQSNISKYQYPKSKSISFIKSRGTGPGIDKGKMLFYNERYGAQEILQSYTLLFVNSVVYMKDEDMNIMFEAKIKSNYKEI